MTTYSNIAIHCNALQHTATDCNTLSWERGTDFLSKKARLFDPDILGTNEHTYTHTLSLSLLSLTQTPTGPHTNVHSFQQ